MENVLRIKQLLYDQGFPIVGARQQLRSEAKIDKGQAAIPFPVQSPVEMQRIRQGLRDDSAVASVRAFRVKARPMRLRAGIDPARLNEVGDDLEVDAFLQVTRRLGKRKKR